MRRLSLALLFVLPAILMVPDARATDLRLTFDAVTTDDQGAPLPAGTVTYSIYHALNGGEVRQVGVVPAPYFTRRDVGAGTHCYSVVPQFAPSTPVTGETWGPGPTLGQVCETVQASGGPRERRPAGVVNLRLQQVTP